MRIVNGSMTAPFAILVCGKSPKKCDLAGPNPLQRGEGIGSMLAYIHTAFFEKRLNHDGMKWEVGLHENSPQT